VRDDGIGFNVNNDQLDETHVGLRIMKERAQRLGAELAISSTPGHGSSIVLTLTPPAPAMAPAAESSGVLA
jgi:two-component system nitrate/nitrite sensor histidine kinase NarX